MEIKDAQGKYAIKVEKQKRIIHIKCVGSFKAEDYKRLVDEVKKMAKTYLPNQTWATLQDLKEYLPSTQVTPQIINESLVELAQCGYRCTAIILESATLKMQLNRSGKDVNGFDMYYCGSEKEGSDWLKTQGF